MKQSNLDLVESFVPKSSIALLNGILNKYSGKVIISKPRKSKLGDFRANHINGKVSISINSDLNQYSFLITLLHELAHYFTWQKHRKSVLPHGKEWKNEFKSLLIPFIQNGIFPENIKLALQNHLNSPKASSCTDVRLFKALNLADCSDEFDFISDLPIGTKFSFQNRGVFQIKERLRKRIKCAHDQSGKNYLFQPITKVKIVNL